MSTRRVFLGTLGKMLGASGVLLPLAGKGALALPTDLGKAAQIPMTAASMPFSPECLQLREIKRALRALPQIYEPDGGDWRRTMVDEYKPVHNRLCARQVRSWADCVELAETIWAFWEKQHRDGDYVGPLIPKLMTDPTNATVGYYQRNAVVALVEGVLSLGGGERFGTGRRSPIRRSRRRLKLASSQN